MNVLRVAAAVTAAIAFGSGCHPHQVSNASVHDHLITCASPDGSTYVPDADVCRAGDAEAVPCYLRDGRVAWLPSHQKCLDQGGRVHP